MVECAGGVGRVVSEIERGKLLKYWFDTEFIEDGKTIDLISIGIVAEDGREYYAISKEFDASKASDWVKENVLAYLPPRTNPAEAALSDIEAAKAWKSRAQIKADLLQFIGTKETGWTIHDPVIKETGKPEFWGYYSAYDHVALCQLFGTMMDLPKGWPMYTRDLKQLCDSLGNPKLPEQGKGEHHALADAKWNRLAHEYLQQFLPQSNK